MTDETLHVDDDLGLWIPPEFREFDSQVVFRTPRATIQHFGSQPLDAFYGLIDESHFGDLGDINHPKNPELAPNSASIKLQGEDAVVFEVENVA
ncbi:hypothetical protein GWK26_08730 [haloarchaeon 3A1-DGR]|nr:hypothetical protein GWK26_08730 [haloarchaeon 3A1-DGR]